MRSDGSRADRRRGLAMAPRLRVRVAAKAERSCMPSNRQPVPPHHTSGVARRAHAMQRRRARRAGAEDALARWHDASGDVATGVHAAPGGASAAAATAVAHHPMVVSRRAIAALECPVWFEMRRPRNHSDGTVAVVASGAAGSRQSLAAVPSGCCRRPQAVSRHLNRKVTSPRRLQDRFARSTPTPRLPGSQFVPARRQDGGRPRVQLAWTGRALTTARGRPCGRVGPRAPTEGVMACQRRPR